MEIKWSNELIKELNEVVSYLKKNSMGKILEKLGNYFIRKHEKYRTFENYSMNFLNDVLDPSIISDGEYNLAFICELVYLKKQKFKNVYWSLNYVINYCLNQKIIKHSKLKINNKTSYMINLIKETLNISDINILFLSITLVKELIGKNVYMLPSLITESENLNLSILTTEMRRNILEILNTKRTLYVRFLLVLSYEISRKKTEPFKIYKNIKFSNQEEMVSILTSSLIETLIYLTSEKIT